jgi:hypothetical protein
VEAKELRDRIKNRYKKLDWKGWRVYDSSEKWTERTLVEIFGVIGKDLGFEIWGTSKKYYEFMALDQVWAKPSDYHEDGIPEVAIESENLSEGGSGFNLVWDDEFLKLLSFNGKYRILIYYCKWKDVEDNFKRFDDHFQDHPFIREDDSLIIITCDEWDKKWKIGLFQKGKEVDTQEFSVV